MPAVARVGYGGRDGERQATSTSSWSMRRTPSTGLTRTAGPCMPRAWCEGSFTATPEAGEALPRRPLPGDPVAALIRFRTAAATLSPTTPGARRAGWRSSSVGENGDETDILATTNPAFVTRTAEEFLELLRLRRPDPETGQPDMEKLGAFLAAHPESQPAIQATVGSEPPASFAQLAYCSPHTFKFVDAAGDGTSVRYRWRPRPGGSHPRRRGPRARPRLPARRARRAASRWPRRV